MTTLNLTSVDPEVQRTAVFANSIFLQTISATSAQIDTLLTGVTTVAGTRPALSYLLQAVAYLINKEIQTPTS